MNTIKQRDVTALVLAGGRARRMGGDDKGLIQVGGRAMVQWVVSALHDQCADVIVNANRNTDRYHELTGCRVITDLDTDYAGPLAGMISGLMQCETPLLACVPCDSPLVAGDLIARLKQTLLADAADLAVAHDGDRMQPVFVLLKRELLGSMQAFVQGGGRKIDAWYAQHNTALTPFADRLEMFDNINTPEQRDALHARLLVNPHVRAQVHAGAGQRMNPPVLGFAAWSGTGKTTLLRKLIPALREGGLRIGIIKHAHHNFDVDHPGKDSYELRHAGAQRVLIGSRVRWALMVENDADEAESDRDNDEPTLSDMLNKMPSTDLDLILVEGFKHESFAKIEVHRASLGLSLLYPEDPSIIALVCDKVPDPAPDLPVLDLNDVAALTEFVRGFVIANTCAPSASAPPDRERLSS